MLLGFILALLNFIYTITFFPKDLAEKSKEFVDIKSTLDTTDIYYFGESSNVTFKPDDSVKNSISELTSFFYPGLRLTNINKFATHCGIYKHWAGQIKSGVGKTQALIITLNLRSFDAAWRHSRLETPLEESVILMQPLPNLVNRFLLALQAFDNKTEKQREADMLNEWKITKLKFPFNFKYKTVREWDDGMAAGGHLKANGDWDNEKITLACHYIKSYAFNLDDKNDRIKDMDEIVAHCAKNKINLYLNLMAENVSYADSLVGKELVFLMRQNRDYLVNRYNKGNCVVVDNFELVKGGDFIDQNWTTEHYGYRGRMRIAKNLAEALKQQFENKYKEAY